MLEGVLPNFVIIEFIPVHPLLQYSQCYAGDVVSVGSGTLCQIYDAVCA
jgi:hypothetical protein